jgi:hypothetical protein
MDLIKLRGIIQQVYSIVNYLPNIFLPLRADKYTKITIVYRIGKLAYWLK